MEQDNIPTRDERGRDQLGFIEERCRHCEAHLYLADDPQSRPICLNACHLSAGAFRRMQQGLAEAQARRGGE